MGLSVKHHFQDGKAPCVLTVICTGTGVLRSYLVSRALSPDSEGWQGAVQNAPILQSKRQKEVPLGFGHPLAKV
eukprot:1159122-Pelagomonas_calceolata.AAC.15